MLKLTKETLTELSADAMSQVVGGYAVSAAGAASTCFTLVIQYPDSCIAASCITND